MKTFVFGSLQAFVLVRPPLVVFTLSLVAITTAIFAVAFYIKDKDLVLDSHAQEDWNSLIKYVTNQNLCINVSDFQQLSKSSKVAKPSIGTCVGMKVEFDPLRSNESLWLRSQKNGNNVRLKGHISLEGWKRSCHADNNASVAISFVLPSTSAEFPDKTLSSSLLYLSGLPLPLPFNAATATGASSVGLCPTSNVSREVVENIFSFDVLKVGACRPENLIQLSFNVSDFKPEIFLSMENKEQILSHLFQLGYIFLGVIFTLLLMGVVQGRTLALSRQHILLPTKEMS